VVAFRIAAVMCDAGGHVPPSSAAPRQQALAGAGVVDRCGWSVCWLPSLIVVTVFVVVGSHYGHQDAASVPVGSPSAAPSLAAPVSPPALASPVAVPGQLINAALGDPATPADATCAGNTQPQSIVVHLAQQRAWMCAGARQVYTTPVTTGQVSSGDATPTGTWTVEDKQADRYLTGPGYSDFVHYWLPFYGDFGLHDATWQAMPFGDQGYRQQGSHGCVHLPTAAMAWLYDWAQIGATVNIDT